MSKIMKRLVIIAISLLAISLTNNDGRNRTDDIEQFITKMYNEKLYEELSKKLASYPNMHVLGFTKDISTLMDSADLYLTKAGGISVSSSSSSSAL